MNSGLLATIYGITSAITFGAGDFSGGLATKKTAVYLVLLFSQIVGGIMMVGLALLFQEPFPSLRSLIYGSLAGVFGGIGLLGLYTGLSRSKMGLIAPLVGVINTVIPVIAGFFLEGLPALIKIFGFGVALAAVWFISTDEGSSRLHRSDLGLAIVSGIGFSLFFVFIDQASNDSAVFWPLVATRLASILLMLSITLYQRELHLPPRETAAILVTTGILDSAGNLFFALASQIGRLDISTVLSSLYPASTILLAWFILNEKLTRRQWLGALMALAALILIAL